MGLHTPVPVAQIFVIVAVTSVMFAMLTALPLALSVRPAQRIPQMPLQSCRATTVAMKLADDGVLGVGVIGAGRIGLVHLEALSACESAKAVVCSMRPQ